MRYKRKAVTDEQKIYDKCDKLYPQLRHGRCCYLCLAAYKVVPSDHIHHIIGRANPITRFYLPNLLPVCAKHHEMIHAGKITSPVSDQHMEHLMKLANKSLKGICIARGITKAEYFQEQLERLKEQIL